MSNVAIVVVAYNRPASLQRLLRSLSMASYPHEVDLVISIDKGGSDEVSKIAHAFDWNFGRFRVIENPVNLGLRRHIIQCGDMTSEYEHVIVLEDDLFVSPAFFNFAMQAAKFYEGDDRIAGISLYKHAWNYLCNRPFEPLVEKGDVFFLQHAMSWGQIWSRRAWEGFKSWYALNVEEFFDLDGFPSAIASWPKSSWLKYHNRYIHETNKFFVYPHNALCTNFSDSGTHAQESTDYQVPLFYAEDRGFRFANFDDARSKYDVYFEPICLASGVMDCAESDLTIDLYGQKRKFKRYVLSSKKLPYKVIRGFGLKLRPHELNIVCSIPGKFFNLYDTTQGSIAEPDDDAVTKVSYDVRSLSRYDALLFGWAGYRKASSGKIKRILAVFSGKGRG